MGGSNQSTHMPTILDAPYLHGFVVRDTTIASPKTRDDSGQVSGAGRAGSRRLPPPAVAALPWLRAAATVARYTGRFLPAVLRRHSFVAPAELPVFRLSTALPARRIGEWTAFFECHGGAIPPLTYFTPETSRLLFRLVGSFGLNFRHLLLLRHELVAAAGAVFPVPDGRYDLEVRVEELRVWPRQRVTFTCRCVARREGHTAPVFETSDQFLVRNVPARDCQALARRGHVGCRADKEPPAPRLDPASPEVRVQRLRIPMEAGIGFGVLSGDLNLVHAHGGLARIFGHCRPFAQGLYTSNRVMATLARTNGGSPTRFSIRFCRPLWLGQEATMFHTEDAFEVLDATGHRVAEGTCGR